MNLRQRFLRYLIGVAIGCVLVYAMFPNRDWLNWLPEKRLMQWVREAQTTITPHGACRMQCAGLTTDSLQQARQMGVINWSLSDPQATPRRYYIAHGSSYYSVLLADSTLTVIDGGRTGNTSNCPCP
jgi:hypothetical protein